MADRIQIRGGDPDHVVAKNKRYALTYEDENGNRQECTEFTSMEDMVFFQTVKDEHGRDLYTIDPAYRMSIQDVAANSPALFSEPTLARRSPIPTNEEFLESLRQEAIREQRDELVDLAGGKSARAKYEVAKSLMEPEFYESAQEMQAATEVATPYADMLKGMKQRGEGPLKWNEPTEDLDAQARDEQAHNQAVLAEMGDTDVSIETGGEQS